MSPQIPFTSKRPSRFSIFSVSPLAASLQPGRPKSIAARGEAAAAASEPTWGKRALRHVAPALAALGLVGGVWAATHHHEATATAKPVTRRGFASPSTKATDDGSTVRWRKDSIDVVVDQTFSDLAGDKVYGNAVDAWRATGATLPSVSTTKGQGRKVGYDPDGSNENIVVYAPYGWAKANGALAITVLTYDDMSGGIVDADVLMNGGGRYFANFDHDQSSDDDDGSTVSIEGNKDGDDSTTTATIKTGQTPRFDVQNVLTHELGHFFGLGEDYTDAHATMYASTRPGETNKRVVTPIDSGVVTALYAQTLAPAQAGAGCGGAKLAQGDTPTGAGLVGFGAAAAGLMLLAASRRNRAVRLIPVRARRGSRAGLARYGGWLTVAGLFTLLTPPDLQAATADQAVRGDAEVEVTSASPRWADGIMETELRLRVTACHVASCPTEEQKIVAFGGRLGNLRQVVGPNPVPEVGARTAVHLRDARGLLRLISLQPSTSTLSQHANRQ